MLYQIIYFLSIVMKKLKCMEKNSNLIIISVLQVFQLPTNTSDTFSGLKEPVFLAKRQIS